MRISHGSTELTITRWVDQPCGRCGGDGQRSYSNTATWRGGIGGAAITSDVCDGCWGTGDAANPGADLRAWEASRQRDVEVMAGEFLASSLGVGLTVLVGAQLAIADHLDALCRKRKTDSSTEALARLLSRKLRALAEVSRNKVRRTTKAP